MKPFTTVERTVHVLRVSLKIHQYNSPIIALYNVCSDQPIMGPSGAVGLNDLAVGNAMDRYFKVKKEEQLILSLSVRRFYGTILKEKRKAQNAS